LQRCQQPLALSNAEQCAGPLAKNPNSIDTLKPLRPPPPPNLPTPPIH
jgi:hypothetical protein